MKLKAVIFGVGKNYRKQKDNLDKKYNIVAFIDNHSEEIVESNLIKSPSSLQDIDFDVVVVTPLKYGEMYDQLIGMGVSPEQILVLDLNPVKHRKTSSFHGGYFYSEYGEDVIVSLLFDKLRIKHPTYMDLGANHPFIASNTAIFYESGSTGIVVEANPRLIKAFEICRPRDVVLNTGVSAESGKASFYMINDVEGRNSFSKNEIEQWGLPIAETLELPMTTLNEIVERYCPQNFPDFLSCDIEGADYSVLESYDLQTYGPKIICVEARWKDVCLFNKLLDEKGYFCFCRIGENQIYVRKEYQSTVCNP